MIGMTIIILSGMCQAHKGKKKTTQSNHDACLVDVSCQKKKGKKKGKKNRNKPNHNIA